MSFNNNDLKIILDLLPNEKRQMLYIVINSYEDIPSIKHETIYNTVLNEIIHDISINNPETIFNKYKEYFKIYELKIVSQGVVERIGEKNILFRARKGNEIARVRDNLTGEEFYANLPFSDENIKAPKPGNNNGSRFNYCGCSYMYLSDTIETCLLEVQAEKEQNVSVGQFKPKCQLKLLNINKFSSVRLDLWKDILLKSILTGEEHYYNVCRFLNKILFSTFNCVGIIYESSFSNGNNYVIYDVSKIELIENSKKIYKIKSIII